MDDTRRAAHFFTHEGGKKLLEHLAPDALGQVAARDLLAVAQHRHVAAFAVDTGAQRRQAFVAHQHQELGLGQVFRRLFVEFVVAALDRIGAVEGQGFAGCQRDGIQRLRR